MLFNSTLYLLYLPAVAILYFLLPLAYRRLMLLLASYAFYWVWSVPFSLLLVASTVLDWAAARIIDSTDDPGVRRGGLLFSMIGNLGVLALFKYADFFSGSVNAVFGQPVLPELNWILPLGISFYTFQTMSYTIDVYRGHLKARKSIMDVALYVSFFPQLVAGPIVRSDVLIPELRKQIEADWVLIRAGIGLVIWGLVKKVFIADSMAPIVNEAYGSSAEMSGLALLQATYAFAVQIYCDFSGYSDIAIGSALILGIRLPENFNAPYLSCSIREFWRRWHISLSTWLRDYLYIPLGGSRKGRFHTHMNLMITMLLGGLWHGAGWNWVVWGGLQGAMMIIERAIGLSEDRPKQKAAAVIRWVVTLHLVCLSWVFFRARDLGHAMEVLERIVTWAPGEVYFPIKPLVLLLAVVAVEFFGLRRRMIAAFERSESLALWAAIAAMILFPLVFRGIRNPEFIYFQF